MNKKQLIAKLSGSLNLSKADAERTFDTITNTILDALKNDDSVKIAGFGTYKVAKRKARIGFVAAYTQRAHSAPVHRAGTTVIAGGRALVFGESPDS